MSRPFRHATWNDVIPSDIASAALEWLATNGPWQYESTSFYLQQGCSNLRQGLSNTPAAFLVSDDAIATIRRHMQRVFDLPFTPKLVVSAHRLLPGHRIGPHTDEPRGDTETHRFVLQLSGDADAAQGGELVLFDPVDVASTAILVPPLHNTAIAMEFAEDSWHAVEEVTAGRRYTILYSFWADTGSMTPAPGDEQSQPKTEGAGRLAARTRLERWGCAKDVEQAGKMYRESRADQKRTPTDIVGHSDRSERAHFLARLASDIGLSGLADVLASGRYTEHGSKALISSRDLKAIACILWSAALDGSVEALEGIKDADVHHSLRWLPPDAIGEITAASPRIRALAAQRWHDVP